MVQAIAKALVGDRDRDRATTGSISMLSPTYTIALDQVLTIAQD